MPINVCSSTPTHSYPNWPKVSSRGKLVDFGPKCTYLNMCTWKWLPITGNLMKSLCTDRDGPQLSFTSIDGQPWWKRKIGDKKGFYGVGLRIHNIGAFRDQNLHRNMQDKDRHILPFKAYRIITWKPKFRRKYLIGFTQFICKYCNFWKDVAFLVDMFKMLYGPISRCRDIIS